MKKIFGLSLLLLSLTSCWAPTTEDPNDILQQNQTAVIENITKIQNINPEQSQNTGTATIEISALEWDANANIWYNLQTNQVTDKSQWNIKVDMNLEANDGIFSDMNMSADFDLDFITLKNKILFQLNELNINSTDFNTELSIFNSLITPFQSNWYFIEDIAENPMIAMQQKLFTKQKEFISLFRSHTLLSYLSTNENTDFYDYNVKVSDETILDFIMYLEKNSRIEKNNDWLLTQSEIDTIKAWITDFNSAVQINIKIDKSDLEYFIITLTHDEGSIIIENSKENFNITMNDSIEKITASILGKKSKGKFDAKILVAWEISENEITELINGSLDFETNGTDSTFSIDMLIKDEYSDDELEISIVINNESAEIETNIQEPLDAKNFEEIVMWIIASMMEAQMNIQTIDSKTDNNH